MLLRLRPFFAFMFLSVATAAWTETGTVVLREPGFPAADSAAAIELVTSLPGARLVSADELNGALNSAQLLVLSYGSAFPEESWPAIFAFLGRGGNLVVIGGRPFTRAAYRDKEGWKLRDYSVRYPQRLLIDQYQTTAGSSGLEFHSNPDLPLSIPQFGWKQAFSPIIHLSSVSLYTRDGSAGSLDATLDALAWGAEAGRRMSVPAVEIDHLRNGFAGGRWIFLNAELGPDFSAGAKYSDLVRQLAERALQGAEQFTVRPVVPLYLPGEPVQVEINWSGTTPLATPSVEIAMFPEEGSGSSSGKRFVTKVSPRPGATFSDTVLLPAPAEKGLHVIEARLKRNSQDRPEFYAIYRSAFWIRDRDFLRSGPRLTVNQDFFELDGKPLAVVGTTYMSSEVQRLYFDHPNVYVWDRDLRQIHDAGLNMIRTGWWTGWDKFADENGAPYERILRTLEAYLMTARKYRLPVQFNCFAFLPEVLGGVNPYLDPEALRKQKTLVSSLATRFADVPFLAYDLINEPSFSKHLWTMLPNGDAIETEKWNEWLNRRYLSRAQLAAAWNVPVDSVAGRIELPEEGDFALRGVYEGHNPLKIYDYQMFAQESFAAWVDSLRHAIREAGSEQMVTVGQDEGGFENRLSPAFFARVVDFTTNHSWWQNDAILWDSLVAKQPGKAMLIQETGLQRELNLDSTSRRTPEDEAALFERKVATSFVRGSGAIEWLWNTNSYMTEGNETPIGAVRADGTEKPEATVLRNFAKFAPLLSEHLRRPGTPQVAIIASQAAQYSPLAELAIEAQRKSVRALAYYARLTPYLIYENQIDKLGSPKLAILASAQALGEDSWQALMKYVDGGGSLLITGPVERDEHWHRVPRAAELVPGAQAQPLTWHNARVAVEGESIPLSFTQTEEDWLESLRFTDGSSFKEFARGKGRIFWTSDPVELAQGEESAQKVYSYVAARLGLQPQFEVHSNLSPGVLVYPVQLQDSVLYVMVSDAAEDANIDLRDKVTGERLALRLSASHAALALLGIKNKTLIAKYGF